MFDVALAASWESLGVGQDDWATRRAKPLKLVRFTRPRAWVETLAGRFIDNKQYDEKSNLVMC